MLCKLGFHKYKSLGMYRGLEGFERVSIEKAHKCKRCGKLKLEFIGMTDIEDRDNFYTLGQLLQKEGEK